MSHLSQEVCGVDIYLSYSKCNSKIFNLVENLKVLLKKNKVTFYSNDYAELNHNYLQTFRIQVLRSKVFLYVIDKFSLEDEWFIYNFIYAQAHNSLHHLPILLPIIFDGDFVEEKLDNNENKLDLANKKKILEYLIKDCVISIKMSEIDSYESLLASLRETLIDIVPFDYNNALFTNNNEKTIQQRYSDSFRPMNSEEENFLSMMNKQEQTLMNGFNISLNNLNQLLPKEKVFLALSVKYDELGVHLNAMLTHQCHLIWIDVICVDRINYFNLLWMRNTDTINVVNTPPPKQSFFIPANPPAYLVLFDINTAKLAEIYRELCIEQDWNIELIDSYVRETTAEPRPTPEPTKPRPKSQTKQSNKKIQSKNTSLAVSSSSTSVKKSNEEIFFICQFKRIVKIENSNNHSSFLKNVLQHSIIDNKFDESLKKVMKFSYKQINIPLRLSPLLLNVNTINNKHFYYTSLYKPVESIKPSEDDLDDLKKEDPYCSPYHSIKKGLSDSELLKLYEEYGKRNWKLIDLKAYKDEKSITRFAAIWTSIEYFYEGASKLFTGLNKTELQLKINEMKAKSLFPRIITNYGYINNNGEQVFAAFFCQF